jgi:type I restriction enzyme S subunit
LFFAIKYFVPALRYIGRGQTFTEISKKQVQDFMIPLAPLFEQRRIAAKIQELMCQAECAQVACEKQLQAVISLPQIILRKAFRGEI